MDLDTALYHMRSKLKLRSSEECRDYLDELDDEIQDTCKAAKREYDKASFNIDEQSTSDGKRGGSFLRPRAKRMLLHRACTA